METRSPPPAVPHLSGLVLCRVGSGRLAFAAAEIASIDLSREESLWAGDCFEGGERPKEGRLLWHELGAVAVDSLEIFNELAVLLPVPPAVSRVMGGAIDGFVEVAGALWPVVGMDRLLRHLKGGPR